MDENSFNQNDKTDYITCENTHRCKTDFRNRLVLLTNRSMIRVLGCTAYSGM